MAIIDNDQVVASSSLERAYQYPSPSLTVRDPVTGVVTPNQDELKRLLDLAQARLKECSWSLQSAESEIRGYEFQKQSLDAFIDYVNATAERFDAHVRRLFLRDGTYGMPNEVDQIALANMKQRTAALTDLIAETQARKGRYEHQIAMLEKEIAQLPLMANMNTRACISERALVHPH